MLNMHNAAKPCSGKEPLIKPHSHIHDLEHDPNTIKRSC